MISKAWTDAMDLAASLRKRKKYYIGCQVNDDWYYMTMFKHKGSHTVNFDPMMEHLVKSRSITGIHVWSNCEDKGFNFQNEVGAAESIVRLFGERGRDQYTVVIGG